MGAGWKIPGWNGRVLKLRLPDPDHDQGKSNGFRLIYDWNPDTKQLYLLRLYTHADIRGDISQKEIKNARREADLL